MSQLGVSNERAPTACVFMQLSAKFNLTFHLILICSTYIHAYIYLYNNVQGSRHVFDSMQ